MLSSRTLPTKKTLTLILVLNSFFGFSQTANDSLINHIKIAEKILITSHEQLNLTTQKAGRTKTEVRTLLKNGKPNKKIIKEQIQLNLQLKEELIGIISNQKTDSIWNGAYCFWPHHTIFIYKQKKWSYIDLCFGCDRYSYSKDLQINKAAFLVTYEDWRKLETFFRSQKLNYEMPKRN